MTELDKLFSELHADPFYRPLLKNFVDDLPKTYQKLLAKLESNNIESARELCHQASGTAATYGYPSLARQFSALEDLYSLKPTDHLKTEPILNSIQQDIEKARLGIDFELNEHQNNEK